MSQAWVDVADDVQFGLANLPYGVFSAPDGEASRRVGVAIGEFVLDVGQLDLPHRHELAQPALNPFLRLGPSAWREVRAGITELLTDASHRPRVEPHLLPANQVRQHLPFQVGDYVDFYASEYHAANVGRIFRPNTEPLTPNWRHLPIGYHGRSGTVVVSGTPIVRPWGQRKAATETAPTFGPSRRLDIEAEVGFVVGVPSTLGDRVSTSDFAEHVFGVVLVNDWSARDIQAWEYVPLGPFLGKSFATSISPWVIPLAALEPARMPPPRQNPPPLPYLRSEAWGLDLHLEVEWNSTVVSRPPFATMYWTAPQQLAHLTVNGASIRAGDLFASGTVSGPERDQRGSFLELSWNGTEPVSLADGSTRTFLEDGDTVTIRGSAHGHNGFHIGLGEVTGTVVPGTPAS